MGATIGWRPGRLLTLWELWEMIVRFDGGELFAAIVGLSNLGHGIEARGPLSKGMIIPPSNHERCKEQVRLICDELERLELTNTLVSAKVLRDIIGNDVERRSNLPGAPPGEWAFFQPEVVSRYKHYSGDVVTRFKDELSARIVMAVAPRAGRYYESAIPLFGDPVFNAFPSANEDIAEAGSCLALGRGTACVMHLMRAAEVGLGALAKAVNVTNQNDWGSYLRKIEGELTQRAQTSGARTADEQFYAEAATAFDHMRRAWRNPTMHVDRTYTPDRAGEIFDAVKAFMGHLATRLAE